MSAHKGNRKRLTLRLPEFIWEVLYDRMCDTGVSVNDQISSMLFSYLTYEDILENLPPKDSEIIK